MCHVNNNTKYDENPLRPPGVTVDRGNKDNNFNAYFIFLPLNARIENLSPINYTHKTFFMLVPIFDCEMFLEESDKYDRSFCVWKWNSPDFSFTTDFSCQIKWNPLCSVSWTLGKQCINIKNKIYHRLDRQFSQFCNSLQQYVSQKINLVTEEHKFEPELYSICHNGSPYWTNHISVHDKRMHFWRDCFRSQPSDRS